MKENQTQEVKTVQTEHDYFLYFSYIVMIAIIIVLYQNGAFSYIHNYDFGETKRYFYAAALAIGVILCLANFFALLGFALFYALFQFALDILEKANF